MQPFTLGNMCPISSNMLSSNVKAPLADVNVVCYSALPSLTYCYARVIRETCDTSATDINVLKTVVYGMKLGGYLRTPCPLGESYVTVQNNSIIHSVNTDN